MCASEARAAVSHLKEVRAAIVGAAAGLPPSLRRRPLCGRWDIRDVLAHLIGWDYTNVQAIGELRSGRVPSFYDHYDPGWASFNASLVEQYRIEDWEMLLEALHASQRAVFDVLDAVPEPELNHDYGVRRRGKRVTIAGILGAAVRDEREHLAQIRALVPSRAPVPGEAS